MEKIIEKQFLFLKILKQLIIDNENSSHYFIKSHSFIGKQIFFIYADCMRIYKVNEFKDRYEIEGYYTIDMDQNLLYEKTDYLKNFQFQTFIDFYIEDETNSKFQKWTKTIEELKNEEF